jgi:glycosyltransferase involved in cell wall biosynthesis
MVCFRSRQNFKTRAKVEKRYKAQGTSYKAQNVRRPDADVTSFFQVVLNSVIRSVKQISVFILTLNSEKYLVQILRQLNKVCDEIVVVDSESKDSTKAIAEKENVRFLSRTFDNFKSQRAYAVEQCKHDLVLMIDSDEIPDDELITALNLLKRSEKILDAYRLKREWHVLEKKIHAVYPVISPDYPVRLFDKRTSNFDNSPVVHEEPSGYKTIGVLDGTLKHFTFETKKEIAEKLERYTSLSAKTLLQKKKSLGKIQQLSSSIAAFIKWYFGKGGWRDGGVGFLLGMYAFNYTFLKYKKAQLIKSISTSTGRQ